VRGPIAAAMSSILGSMPFDGWEARTSRTDEDILPRR
jgi:hypothetical protein